MFDPSNETSKSKWHACPNKTHRTAKTDSRRWWKWLFPLAGLVSLVWFLIRVLPKPGRATYPCQRAAAPLASGFVVWLLGAGASAVAFRKAKNAFRLSRYFAGAVLAAMGVGAAWLSLSSGDEKAAVAARTPVRNAPIGTAKGINPGRVVWVHDPNATNWAGFDSSQHWFDNTCTSQAVIDKMMSQSVRSLTGQGNDLSAWDSLFRFFNINRGKGNVGYQPGEKICIKLNLVTCNVSNRSVDNNTYEKLDVNSTFMINNADTAPQMVVALFRQLVNKVGVNQSDITVGDPTCLWVNQYYNIVHGEFPNVHYEDYQGTSGRQKAAFSTTPFGWSDPASAGTTQDYLPVSSAQAAYLINFACLKGHSSGVTLCGKNNYGSLIRLPNGNLWNVGYFNYFNMHNSLPNSYYTPGTGHYRAIVDFMGHKDVGGKTLLYLIDGLYGGYYSNSHPYKWLSAPFNNDWPSSLFASQDPVAIDSVGYDFLLAEWPKVVLNGASSTANSLQGGADDYLYEAAQANNPPSGTFYDPEHDGVRMASLGVQEHWDDNATKRYSRNLGTGNGIELVTYDSQNYSPQVDAGTDAGIAPWDNLTLHAVVSDDGLPNPPGIVRVTWRKLTGPGTVTLTTLNATDSRAQFGSPGTYVLEAQASDGQYISADNLTVKVYRYGDANHDGRVDAADLSILLEAMDTARNAAGWDDRVDSDRDGQITSTDLAILLANMDPG